MNQTEREATWRGSSRNTCLLEGQLSFLHVDGLQSAWHLVLALSFLDCEAFRDRTNSDALPAE